MEVKKYLNIYWERAIIAVKQSNEYKINFHMMNIYDLFHILAMLLFYFVLQKFTNDFLDWNLIDFAIYWLLTLLSWKILWLFHLIRLDLRLLKGELNQHLLRPVNTFFLTCIQNLNGNNLVSLFYIIPLTFGLIIYNSYKINLLLIFFIIFSWFYFLIFFNCLKSISFFMKKSYTITDPILELDDTIWTFTPKLFNNFKFKDLIYLAPSAIQSYLVIELLKGNSKLLLNYLPLIFSTFIGFIILTIFLWHFGLKKYEGYN